MDRTTFEINGNSFQDFAGFVAEFNREFVTHVGGKWNGNLDAFNDYLSWTNAHSIIRWSNSAKSRNDLGHDAMADWLSDNLQKCHPSNRPSVHSRLDNAKNKNGPTLFDTLVEIMQMNAEYVTLQLA
ncbi:barstar family protein [Crateriforma conspicua]|uniref:Uncharacterized protein n=1 Tax=Crateriforma conspicua TaxID=2527996 RepID=A0A5C6FHK2_9PLAN|nr:barstar family protein [Crateriforma conspicua]TWU59506.1 hypothetical protein V7x_56060 [Crateriforma conspicua]